MEVTTIFRLSEEEQEQAEKRRKEEEQEAEKKRWIAQFGSERLRQSVEKGYDSQDRYATERAQKELGKIVEVRENCTLYCSNKFYWEDRKYPSLPAIALERKLKQEGHQARTVLGYLCRCPEEYDCYCKEYEMVIIQNYLGTHTVIVWENKR